MTRAGVIAALLAAVAGTLAPADAALAQTAAAQPPPAQAGAPPEGRAGRRGGTGEAPMTPAEVERMWDTYVAAEARTALSLTGDQFPAFTARLQNLQMLRRRLQRQHNVLRGELNRLVAGTGAVDEAAVTAKLDEFDEFTLQSARQVRRAYAGIDALLTPRQRVRFRLFEERMAQRKLELLAEARRAARRGGGGGGREPAL